MTPSNVPGQTDDDSDDVAEQPSTPATPIEGSANPPKNPDPASKEADAARNSPGARQAEGGTQQAPGVSAINTQLPESKEKAFRVGSAAGEPATGQAVEGKEVELEDLDDEIKDEHPEPENYQPDSVLKPAEPYHLQAKAAPKPEKLVKNSRRRLTDKQIDALSRAELRAVATDRGYEMPFGGRNVSKEAFKKAQAEDDSLEDAENGQKNGNGEEK